MRTIIKLLKSIPFLVKSYHQIHNILSTHFDFFAAKRIQKYINSQNTEARKNDKKLIFIMTEANDRMDWFFESQIDSSFQILNLPREIFILKWKVFFKNYISHPFLFDLENYMSSKWDTERNTYKEHVIKLLKIIQDIYNPETILLPKLNTNWQMDIIECMNELNMTVCVEDRESGMHPKALETFPKMLKNYLDPVKHKVDFLNAHNLSHRQFFIEAGVNPDVIRVHGCPQTDFWFTKKKWKNIKKIHPELSEERFKIYFLSFGPRVYVHFYFKGEERDWIDIIDGHHEVLGQLLKEHGDKIQIIYKLGKKKARDTNPHYSEFIAEYGQYITKENFLELGVEVSSYQLATISDVTMGFQTTGLIEGMFLDKPILYGAWGDLFEDIKDELLPLHTTEALTHCDSKSALKKALIQLILNPKVELTEEIKASRKEFISRYFYNSDGKVCFRILEDLCQFLKSKTH